MEQNMVYPIAGDIMLCEAVIQGRLGEIIKPKIDLTTAFAYSLAHDSFSLYPEKILDKDVPVRQHRIVLANEILFIIFEAGVESVSHLVERDTLVWDEQCVDLVNRGYNAMCAKFDGVFDKVPLIDDYLDTVVNNYTAIYN